MKRDKRAMGELLGVNYYVLPSGCCTRHYMIRFFFFLRYFIGYGILLQEPLL